MGYLTRGIAYLKLGMADSMLADLDKVRQLYPIYPSLPQLYYHAAVLCRQKGDIERAAAILHTAADLAPGDTALRNIVHMADAEADSLRAVSNSSR